MLPVPYIVQDTKGGNSKRLRPGERMKRVAASPGDVPLAKQVSIDTPFTQIVSVYSRNLTRCRVEMAIPKVQNRKSVLSIPEAIFLSLGSSVRWRILKSISRYQRGYSAIVWHLNSLKHRNNVVGCLCWDRKQVPRQCQQRTLVHFFFRMMTGCSVVGSSTSAIPLPFLFLFLS